MKKFIQLNILDYVKRSVEETDFNCRHFISKKLKLLINNWKTQGLETFVQISKICKKYFKTFRKQINRYLFLKILTFIFVIILCNIFTGKRIVPNFGEIKLIQFLKDKVFIVIWWKKLSENFFFFSFSSFSTWLVVFCNFSGFSC